MTFVIGLTGSIGMGKSTTAQMFADEGVPVWDADAAVRSLYAPGGAAVDAVREICPDAIEGDAVSRDILRQAISADPTVLDRLNQAIHPLVAANREDFLKTHEGTLVLLDVPLLFEAGGHEVCDVIVVVSVPEDVQKARVLARGEMTEQDFELILSRQMPDAEKRARADYVIPTLDLDDTRKRVQSLVKELRSKADA